MAEKKYKIKRGDNLTKIADGRCGADVAASIAGNTVQAKIKTLVKLNNIKNPNVIITGEWLILSKTGGSNTPSSTSTNPPNNAVITTFGLKSDSTSGREVAASWTWHKLDPEKDKFDKFKIRWEWDTPNPSNPKKPITKFEESDVTNTWAEFTIPSEFQKTATWVKITITPIAKFKKNSKGEETKDPEWTARKSFKTYKFSENPPDMPEIPECEIEDTTLTMKLDEIKKETDISYIIFQVVKNNASAVYTSPKQSVVAIKGTDYYKISHTYKVSLGSNYKVRAKSVGKNKKESGWTEFSEEVATKPSAPTMKTKSCRRVLRDDDTQAAHLEWNAVANATKYIIEYTNIEADFDNGSGNYNTKETEDNKTSIEILFSNDQSGKNYYFRVRAVNSKIQDQANQTSEPSKAVLISVGSIPDPPTTWSTSDSAFEEETMELNWIHNSADNSKQTKAEIEIKINGVSSKKTFTNDTDEDDVKPSSSEANKWTYGQGISYKGTLYFKMDTSVDALKNAKIEWRVRTAGITKQFGGEDSWSVWRTVYIYEKPSLILSMTDNIEGEGNMIETLNNFPFYIRGEVDLDADDYSIQRPIGYHLQIQANDHYTTVDDVGRTKVINPGDIVYSKYFDTSETLIVEMSADNIDLESGVRYKAYCYANMSTGLTIPNEHEFTVNWVDDEHSIDVDISIDPETYAASITPYCREKIPVVVGEGDDAYTTYEDGELISNVTLSVYRREYDGSYKEIATGIPNDYTSVTDPHPSLDFARYRFVAKDTLTGALSFWDMAGHPVNCSSVILQWDEEWTTFDTGESTNAEGPSWSGSLLKLPYNIKVTDNRKREVTLIEYAGREHPVSYYGTQLGETSQWSVDIPADDKETIYALRRLSIWSGDVYVREPSGMGFWADVTVSFNQSYSDLTIPVSLDITRVEGGV